MEHTLSSARNAQLWSPDSWKSKPALQQSTYRDAAELERALAELGALPPLVTSWEVLALKRKLADAEAGRCFLLQGGDCAESFSDCTPSVISNRLKVLLQMSLVLVHGLKLPVVRVGRFAGQYAKPRSAEMETRDGVTLPCYRGDIINGSAFTAREREPDPRRMIDAHSKSALTMNFVRALIDGGFADLHHPEYWDLEWVSHAPLRDEYWKMAQSVGESIRFMEALGGQSFGCYPKVDFYTSHEMLLLPYESTMTRQVPQHEGWFNLSTHFPWIGMRTAQLDGAHVEYCAGISNPIGLKVGPSVKPEQLLRVIEALDRENEPGRLTIITRMGAEQVESALPPLLRAVKSEGRRVLWCCDPMHGNSETTAGGVKTRRFENIRSELEAAFTIHAACGTRLGGVHLELTGENVTECLGGARNLREADLAQAYKSTVDPRLNYEQSLEIAMQIVRQHSSTVQQSKLDAAEPRAAMLEAS
ncbi:class II 3-deoxy-7-phosphoheptulonate synthase [Chromobacterium sp. IIBBL 290-4]|uniref:class II 3-deoxy-7-phosphoheptulonate synthase n=1 Tax=Chromobacterium sp. IIBBL 290-4 TaxID=2953890 RepID=UPI0020B88E64|nr:3-deoxy-7-phosphoheptulonate synthase class II [Chromobacterium sp. IIBBL 290-4]UTH76300.1 3-deoxy-7-phosphoheptulonate synthase class II [Chromobacterium sp. IIBBL 290-4]